jgi:hypothetical protein
VNKVDGSVSQSSFGQLPAIFPRVMPSAMFPLNFHPLCYPVSAPLIALPVNAFQCLINEAVLIIFLSLSSIDNLQQPVGSEKYCDHHFFRADRGSHSSNDFISRRCKHCQRIIIVVESALVPSHDV